MYKEYIAYLKDNPEHKWFKRKLYGWGWTPATKEGWLTLLGFLVLVFLVVYRMPKVPTTNELIYQFGFPIGFLVLLLLVVCYKKGESPRWQWGPPKDEKNNEG